MRFVIVTAADETLMPLLQGLVQSLHQWGPLDPGELACLDLGLSPSSRDWLRQYTKNIVSPGWDLPVAPTLAVAQPYLRALTVRPFLPRYFPGYDIYLWIDVDAWVQEWFAIEWYLSAAANGNLAITAQSDRSYRHSIESLRWRFDRLRHYYGWRAAWKLATERYFNAGVFALRFDSPLWAIWARWFRRGLNASLGMVCCDQTALNYAVWTEQLPVHVLPTVCNWTCHLAMPGFDPRTARFQRPCRPYETIGLMHLTAGTKDAFLELPDEKRHRISVSLRFSHNRKPSLRLPNDPDR